MNDRYPISNYQNCYRYFKRPNLNDPQNTRNSVFLSPKEHQVKGDIRLGYIQNSNVVFGILKTELVRHLAVYGSSGTGKSNFLRVLQLELYRLGIPFLVFDTAKYGSRFLKHYMNDLIVLRWDKDFYFNPLQPPQGVTIKEWLMVFCEVTTEIFSLRTASKLYLTEFILNELYPKDNSFVQSDFPTMHDLNRRLEKRLKDKIPINERGYINALHSKIKAICLTLDKIINVHEGILIEDILKYPVCIELVGIKSSEIQYWLISLLMSAISSFREHRPMAFGSLCHVLFLDEASHVVGKRGNINKESSFNSNMRRRREDGGGFVILDQNISSINDIVKNNTYTIIGMAHIGQKDRREMIIVLGLDAAQASAFNRLDVGQAIARLSGRYLSPQLITIPFVKPINLSELELDKINTKDQRIKDLLNKVKPATGSEMKDLITSQSIPQHSEIKKPISKSDAILEKSKGMLFDIYNRFDVPSTQRSKDFCLSGSSADNIFKYIEKEQLVEVVKLNLSGMRGGISKYFVLTHKGYEVISKESPKKSSGTGATHFFLERYLKKHLPENGFSYLEIEKNIGGKRIDLFGTYNGIKVGIEICVSTIKTEFINIQKDQDKCDVLVIVTPDNKTKEKLIKELFGKIDGDKNVKVCVVHELLSHSEDILKTF